MNRVLNKGFASKSSNNPVLIVFSDVFHPAYCMQNYPDNGMGGICKQILPVISIAGTKKSGSSRKGVSDEEL